MEAVPLEIVTEIARELATISDVRNLRLVSRAFAYAASPVLFYQVQAINTVECLNKLSEYQRRPFATVSTARHLTLHHATWPQIESFGAWTTHPQTLSLVNLSEQAKLQAYSSYRHFMYQEMGRTFDTDVSRLIGILGMLPNLTSLTLSHIHAWRWDKLKNDHYEELSQRIRVVPFFKALVEDLTSRLLPILSRFPQITKLKIPGTLDIRGGEWVVKNESIMFLDVSNIVVRGYEHDEVQSFLRSFPNLQELVLGTESGGQISEQRIALRSLQWPNLRRIHFRHLWTSENDLVDFVGRHQLQQLVLRNVTLFGGSWESFFNRVSSLPGRTLKSAVCITAGGAYMRLVEAARSYSRWPSSNACALKPRVYVMFGGDSQQSTNFPQACGLDDRHCGSNKDFWFTD
ncbi:hypothetical protein NW762_012843 [Fusarium torreyae]|uniref:F-box domain-containing protein n=1 Tax=Fusarium torreyae TaxID=1237075 RepID=A0A9W8RLL8_9HYPO|nr:hypothetical protein NW762_012843 [Fusarium torreyae]